jgi:dihydroorotase
MARQILEGGRVIDPVSGYDRVADVVIDGDRVTAIGPGLAAQDPDSEKRDVTGLLVTPGLIDLHTHVYLGLGNFCVHPDDAGVRRGVTTVVDGGTSGVATFGLARRWIDDPAVATRILAFMDPCQLYLATGDFICHRLEIANDERNLDIESTAEALADHADVVVGLKVRACSTTDPEVSPFVEGAKAVAGHRPVMVHLGRFPHTPTISTASLLGTLRSGDIITHAYRGASGVLDADTGKAVPEFAAAVDGGLRLDVGHSATDFRFATARRLFDLGYLPTTISTDLNIFNIDGPVWSLPETMSKIWALGVPLADVVAMVTANPAEVIGRAGHLGQLAPGREADITVLRIDEGPADLSDGFETLTADRRLAAVGCLRAGIWFDAVSAPLSSGGPGI